MKEKCKRRKKVDKVKIFWEGHTIWKKCPTCLLSNIKTSGIFSKFLWPYQKNPNFTWCRFKLFHLVIRLFNTQFLPKIGHLSYLYLPYLLLRIIEIHAFHYFTVEMKKFWFVLSNLVKKLFAPRRTTIISRAFACQPHVHDAPAALRRTAWWLSLSLMIIKHQVRGGLANARV